MATDSVSRPGGDAGTGTTARGSPTSTVRSLALGLLGGGYATAVMTLFRVPITDSLPPTAEFWAKYVGGGDPGDYPVVGLLLHVGYGMAAALPFALGFDRLVGGPDVRREVRGATAGTAYGLALSAFGSLVLLDRLLDLNLDPDERWIFHVSHVVYGLALGSWVGSRASASTGSAAESDGA